MWAIIKLYVEKLFQFTSSLYDVIHILLLFEHEKKPENGKLAVSAFRTTDPVFPSADQ